VNDPSTSRGVPLLATVTLAYCEDEDRIRLDGVDTDGLTQSLWLTARLLGRLVPHLIARQADTRLMLGDSQADRTQQASDSGVSESPEKKRRAVECLPGSPETLVMSVDLSAQESQLMLVFKDSQGLRCAAFAMPYEALTQWNRGLQQCFEQAGWAQGVFQPHSVSGQMGQGTVTVH